MQPACHKSGNNGAHLAWAQRGLQMVIRLAALAAAPAADGPKRTTTAKAAVAYRKLGIGFVLGGR